MYPELDRTAQLDDSIPIAATIEEMFPLLAAIGFPLVAARGPSFLSPCPFYDQFAPEPLKGPLDGGGVPILVIGNHSDPVTPFSESEELVSETLSSGYLLETSHFKHTVYPENNCVNNHVHRALIDGVHPSERRLFCEEVTATPVSTTKTGPLRRRSSPPSAPGQATPAA